MWPSKRTPATLNDEGMLSASGDAKISETTGALLKLAAVVFLCAFGLTMMQAVMAQADAIPAGSPPEPSEDSWITPTTLLALTLLVAVLSFIILRSKLW